MKDKKTAIVVGSAGFSVSKKNFSQFFANMGSAQSLGGVASFKLPEHDPVIDADVAVDPNKKLAIIALPCLFGSGRDGDINEKNTGLVKQLKDNGVDVLLTYLNKTWVETAERVKETVGADAIAEDPSSPHAYGFAELAAEAGVEPKNVLCIELDFYNGIAIQRAGMTLCTAAAYPAHLLMSEAKNDLVESSQKGFDEIQAAVDKFILA